MIRITFTIILLCQAISGAFIFFLFIFILMAIMTIGGMPYFMVFTKLFPRSQTLAFDVTEIPFYLSHMIISFDLYHVLSFINPGRIGFPVIMDFRWALFRS